MTKYSRPTKVRFVGVWDTVGSLGLPVASAAGKVHKYKFLDTHLRLDNEYAFHALALDEHRHNFEPTFWTRTVQAGQAGAPDRAVEHVEQRWFIGAHANVGEGYASEKWLMDKAGALGLDFRDQVVIDPLQVAPPVTDSYREFAHGFYRFISRPFYRPVGLAPDQGAQATTSRINETIDGSVFERWRADAQLDIVASEIEGIAKADTAEQGWPYRAEGVADWTHNLRTMIEAIRADLDHPTSRPI